MLALLLANAGQSVPLSTIIDVLWFDDPPTWAVNVVHKHVGALRRVVEPGLPRRAQGEWLLSDAGGYRVVADQDSLDLLRFRHLAERADRASDPRQRMDLLGDSLDLWRGSVAEDLKPEIRAAPVFAAIEHEYAVIAVRAAQLARQLGQSDRVLPALRRAALANPTDEIVHAHLVRCLAGAGRRADALEVFATMRSLLVTQLGVSPGPDLTAAQLEVLRDDVAGVSSTTALPTPTQLPANLPDFVGRDRELRTLALTTRRPATISPVVAITGTAGVGKTALAVRYGHTVAETFPDGQLYINLRGFDPSNAPLTPREVLGRFLDSLDVPRSKIPQDLEARAALYRSAMSGRRILVILDNARNSAQVTPLLPGGDGCLTIITSRQQLRAVSSHGAEVLPLDLFDQDQSADFLRNRLGPRHLDDPDTDHDAFEVTAGLPLALALLAARAVYAAHLSLSEIVQSVKDSSSWLNAFVDRDDPRTDARAVLSWSYDALSSEAARLFRLLALHPGASISVTQAAHVAGLPAARARELIDELAEANVVSEHAPDRWARHDLLKRYAAEMLAGETPARRREAEIRLYQYFANAALTAARRLSPARAPLPDPDAWAGAAEHDFADEGAAAHWFDVEHSTLVALITRTPRSRGRDPYTWRLAWALEHYLDRRGRWSELLATQQAAVAATQRSASPIVQASALRGVARAETNLGRLESAATHVRNAIRYLAADERVDRTFYAETHRQLSWIREQQGNLAGALDEARSALGLLADDSTEPVRAFALNAVGWYEALLGRHDAALEHCTAAARLLAGSEHRYGLADTWSSLGYINFHLGHTGRSVSCLRRSLRLFQALGVRYAEASVALDLGRALARTRYRTVARRVVANAGEIFEQLDEHKAQEAAELLAALSQSSASTAISMSSTASTTV